ncbi:MAG: hypothetical protein ABI824_10460 [Acidobacteriota bacterium]
MSEKEKPKSDIEDVMKAETRRGRRPIDIEEKRKRAARLREMNNLLKIETEEEFLAAMRAFGPPEDSEEFQAALRVWRGGPGS